MFCSKCGNQVADGERFCAKCGNQVAEFVQPVVNGAAVVNNDVQAQPVNVPPVNAQPVNWAAQNNGTVNAKKLSPKMLGGLIAACAGAFLLLVIVVAAVLFYKPTVKLNKYLSVEFNGYDTVGTATYTFDYSAFYEDWGEKLKVNKSAVKKYLKEELGSLYGEEFLQEILDQYTLDPAGTFSDEIYGSLDKYDRLSNGDTVIFTWSVDEESLEKFFKCNVKFSDKEFEVEGLADIQKYDPFTTVEVEFYGMSPNASASINHISYPDESGYLYYSLDRYDGLKNGDTVTVTVQLNTSEERFAELYGKIPYPMEKTYTVEGLASYITDISEISEDLIQQMQSQSEDVIRSYVANNWESEVTLEELSYLGNYFLSRKTSSSYTDTRVYMVYRLTAKQTMETESGTVVENVESYYYVSFYNPMIDTDGSGKVDITNYGTPSWDGFTVETDYVDPDSWWGNTYSYYYRGFESLEKLYNEVVTKNLEYYNHQDNVTE